MRKMPEKAVPGQPRRMESRAADRIGALHDGGGAVPRWPESFCGKDPQGASRRAREYELRPQKLPPRLKPPEGRRKDQS